MTGAMPADLPALFKDFGLDYHFEHLSLAIEMFGPLKGKRVLEIGGCLPREIVIDRLEAGEWIGTDLPGYWDESGDDNPSRRIGMNRKPLQGFNPGAVDHVCLEGDVLELDSSLDGRFDLVFSVSAFEHIADIPATLSVASRALKEGGGLFATALPIWPSEKGHHLPPISDGGKEVSFSMLQVPPWPHLTLRPNELSKLLMPQIPRDIVDKIVYYCFESSHINRCFFEDYEMALGRAAFAGKRVGRIPGTPPPADVLGQIESRFGKRRYDCAGICLVATR